MAVDEEATEHSRLLDPRIAQLNGSRHASAPNGDATSIMSSHISKEEQALGGTAIGERLPYNDYTTIDWLHDLVSIGFLLSLRNDTYRAYRSRTHFDIEHFIRDAV